MAGNLLEITDITKEAINEYEALIAMTGISSVKSDEEIPFSVMQLGIGHRTGKLLISNNCTSGERPQGKYRTTITEHWMVFPDEIAAAVNDGLLQLTGGSILFNAQFSLHTFSILCITLDYRSQEAQDTTQKLWDSGRLCTAVVQSIKAGGYEGDINVEYNASTVPN